MMLDLGRSFLASTARDPDATAVVEGETRLSYAEWLPRISALAAALSRLGVGRGERVLSVQQNTLAAATLHWACQLGGIAIVPVNWRATVEELGFFLEDSGAKAVVFDAAARAAVEGCTMSRALPRITCDGAARPGEEDLAILTGAARAGDGPVVHPQAGPDDISVILYTSGTTARPKGVPRSHRAERAAAIAHVAQNLMPRLDTTLGVMPLYHTMGVRSLLAMSLLGGTFVCLPKFDASAALRLIETERVGSLYLVPTLYHDLLNHPDFDATNISACRRLGYAGAAMTDGLLDRVNRAFGPDLFVNHYGSSEIYTFSIEQEAAARPGSAGRAAMNQILRVVEMGKGDPEAVVPPGTEGEIIALLAGDEAFAGYWERPDADEKSLRQGWYFTGDSGRFDARGDLYVTGRVDDMIITGGENVSPVEVESTLSTHPAVEEAAVVGLPDERWGKIVVAYVRCREEVSETALDAHCRNSRLARFKRPRRYVFVAELPKSPVGKLLRRVLVSDAAAPSEQGETK